MLRFSTLALTALLATAAPISSICGQEAVRADAVGASTALRSYAPGKWGIVRAEVKNLGEEAATLPAEVYLKDNPSLRFARDVWVPPHSRRATWIPLHVPQDAAASATQATVVGEAGGRTFAEQSRLMTEDFPMALLQDSGMANPFEEKEDETYELVLAMRSSLGLSRHLLVLGERFLPPTVEAWDTVGHILLAGNRLAGDTAGQAALRHWLASGGRMWIQLNSTPPESVQSLLGDAFRVEVIDRVALSTLPEDFTPGVPPEREHELEEQIELMRVVVDDAEVLSEVYGWPASFAIPFGRGEVVVTTLGPKAWMRPSTKEELDAADITKRTSYAATDNLRDLQWRFLKSPYAELPGQELQREYLAQKIGYQVPGRTIVLSLLLGFCAFILVAGFALSRRLEHLAWLTVAAGVVAGGAVIGLGTASRQAVPPTAGELQFVQIVSQADTVASSGSLAIYQPDLASVELTSSVGMRLNPQLPDLAGQIRRLHWIDLNRWRFDQMELPPGVRMFDAQTANTASDLPRAVARFGAQGLEGSWTPGIYSQGEDALIAPAFATPLAANLNGDGSFHAGPTDLLASGQFTADQLLSDEQLRRQQLAQAWFAGRLPDSPVNLMVWAEPLASGSEWSASTRRVGSQLVSVPLTIERTAPNISVAIPDALMSVRTVSGSSGQSTCFDYRKRQWQYPQTAASTTRLRWQLPAAVLPVALDRATFTLEGNVPSRQLSIYVIRNGERIAILQQSSPGGQITIDITEADQLRLDEQGGMTIEIVVGELGSQLQQDTANATWSIRSTTLDAWGKTMPEGKENP